MNRKQPAEQAISLGYTFLFFTTKFMGRGLGLPSVHGVVQSQAGGLLLTSHPGQGTTVRILFPIPDKPYTAMELAPTRQTEEDKTKSPHTILVVDDAAMIRMLSQKALELSAIECSPPTATRQR